MNHNQLALFAKPDFNLMPREKMEFAGVRALSNEELLAIILGSGSHECSVFELARRLSQFCRRKLHSRHLQVLSEFVDLEK